MLDKLKQLTKDTAVYGISTILGRFLNFALVPFYTNIFLPADYGIITNYYALIALMNIVFLYGMDSAFLKFASTQEVGDEKDNFSTPFISVVITSISLVVILGLLRNSIASFLGAPDTGKFVLYSVAILAVDALAALPFIKLRLLRKAKKFSLFKVLNIVTNVIFNFILVINLNMGIEGVFLSNLIASVVSLLLLIPEITKYLKLSFHVTLLKRLLKFGIPYLPAGIGSMIIQVIDRPIMEHLAGLHNVGIYQANHKLGIFMMLFVNMFQFAWQPFFMQNAKEENAKDIFSKVLTYFVLAGCIILVVLSLTIDDLVKLNIFGYHLIGRGYWSGLHVVPVVLAGYLFNGIYFVFTAGIFIKEKSIYVPFIIGAAALINIASNFLLIPYFNLMGPALSALISYAFISVCFYIVTQKIYTITYEYNKLIKIALTVIPVFVAYYILYFNNLLNIYLKILMLILFLIAIYFVGLDNKEKAFIKRKMERK